MSMLPPPSAAPATAASYTCPYCRLDGDATGTSCTHCGAPVDIRARVSESGWEKQPAIKDMARIQFGQSTCQVSGMYVPAAELRLAQGESVYFSHDSLLWADMQITLGSQSLKGAWTRKKAGLPLVMMEATGPGQLALSDNNAGETIAVPLLPGRSVEVREHRFLMATENVTYDWFQSNIWYRATEGGGGGGIKKKAIGGGLGMLASMVLDTEIEAGGDKNEVTTHYPAGNFLDRFSATDSPGLLLLHGRGNVFTRDLAEGQTICVHAGAFVWKDATVGMGLHLERPKSGGWFVGWQPATPWLRMWGPGRVAVSSAYEPTEGTGRILNTSQASLVDWNQQMPAHLAGIGSVRGAAAAASTHDDKAFEAALDAFATSQGFTAGKDRNLAAVHSHAYSHPGGIEIGCRVVDTAASVAAVSSMTGMLGSRMAGLSGKISAKMESRLGAPTGGEPLEGLGVPATWKQTGDDSAVLAATKNGKVFTVNIKARMSPQDMMGWARAFAAAGLAAMQ